MPYKQGKRRGRGRGELWEKSDPDGFGVWAERYFEWMRIRNYSPRTVTTRDKQLLTFVRWCAARSLRRPSELTKPIIERYQRHLFYWRTVRGRPLSFRTQRAHLQTVQAFFKWLARQNAVVANPASDLELPRLPQALPKAVLSAEEVERVMLGPELGTAVGLRDRAALEVLYATGIRRSELVALQLWDIDEERGTLIVRQGKGKKDRVLPIAERTLRWVRRYVDEVRPGLVVLPDDGWLFLTTQGDPLLTDTLSRTVRGYVEAAELGKSGACHLFRHTMATLMLEGGADVRHIQEMLGHASLDSTEIYTRVSIRKLKAIYDATHPAAKLERPSNDGVRANAPGDARDAIEQQLSLWLDEERQSDDEDEKHDGRK